MKLALRFTWIVCILLILLVSQRTLSSAQGENSNSKVRVIAHTDQEVSDAVADGCKIARAGKTLTALICPPKVASQLGLQEDVRVFAMDSGANLQIRSNLVNSGGNNGQGRKVVVLDTGYNYTHPELSSSYLGGKDFVNNDSDPLDDDGHGSHVAGLITGDGVDGKAKGVASAAGIISGKVLDAQGSGYFSDVVEAIYWAVDGPDGLPGTGDDFGADAINLSLGTSAPYLYKGYCDGVLPDLTAAIKHATDKNVTVAVAAGNSGSAGVSLPGCISYSLTVGAVDKYDRVASFSGRGSALDLTAPGVSLYSAWLGSQYVYASGTSMATPVAAGVVALVKYAHSGYTSTQVRDALTKTAKDLGSYGFDTKYGWGRLDAQSAVNYNAL